MTPCDIVIVGHGAAGLCAAVSAAETALERGLKVHITVIERAPEAEHGGNSRWTPSYIRMPSVAGVAPGFAEDIVLESDGRADTAYFQRLAEDAGPSAAWLQQQGVTFHTPVYYLAAGPARIQPVGGGAAIIGALLASAQRLGVVFHYGHAADALKLDEAGAVSGVELDDGRVIPAHRVILASGGFAGNADMLGEHFGPAARSMKPISPGTRANTGAGIRMALAVGAQPAGDWHGMHAEPIDARSSGPAPVVLVYPYGIVVDQNGDRFFDEGAGLVHETWETFARHIHMALPGHQAYAILDSRLLDISHYERAIRSEVAPIRADSIAELAALLGIPAERLQATVSDYNAAATADTTHFDATHTDGITTAPGYTPPKSNWARPITQPPYLAWPLIGAVAYTFGGIATNPNAEVLGVNGPIPGLYAAGEITGHFHGTAPNAVAMLRAIVFGRVAGSQAVLDR